MCLWMYEILLLVRKILIVLVGASFMLINAKSTNSTQLWGWYWKRFEAVSEGESEITSFIWSPSSPEPRARTYIIPAVNVVLGLTSWDGHQATSVDNTGPGTCPGGCRHTINSLSQFVIGVDSTCWFEFPPTYWRLFFRFN